MAVAVSGCGSSGEKLSTSEADRALAALDSIQDLVDEGRCKAAQRRVDLLIAQASKVNQDRQDLGTAYAKSADRLQELVSRECVEIKETTPTDAVTSATGPTEVPEPTSTPEPPQPEPTDGGTVPDTPNNNGGDNGNGGGGGGGNNTPPDNSGGARPQ